MLDHTQFGTAADLPPEQPVKPNGKSHPDNSRPIDQISAADLQAMEFPPIAWVVPRYVAEGATILAGKPKLGKSWLALDMAVAVARGGYLLGDIICAQGDVLYCALEDNRRRLQGRMRKVVGDIPWPPRLFFRTKLQRLSEGGIGELRKWIVSVPKLVNNQLWKIHAAAIGEAMVTAKLAGLEPEVWWDVMKGGAADSFVMQHDVPSIFAGHYDPSFPIALCLKFPIVARSARMAASTPRRPSMVKATLGGRAQTDAPDPLRKSCRVDF